MKNDDVAISLLRSVDSELQHDIEAGKDMTGRALNGTIAKSAAQFCQIMLDHSRRQSGSMLTSVLEDPVARLQLMELFQMQQRASTAESTVRFGSRS